MTITCPLHRIPDETTVTTVVSECVDLSAFLTVTMQPPWAEPTVVDDTPAALIARLTAGDRP